MWILFLIKINEEIIKVKYNIILNIKFNNIYVYIIKLFKFNNY